MKHLDVCKTHKMFLIHILMVFQMMYPDIFGYPVYFSSCTTSSEISWQPDLSVSVVEDHVFFYLLIFLMKCFSNYRKDWNAFGTEGESPNGAAFICIHWSWQTCLCKGWKGLLSHLHTADQLAWRGCECWIVGFQKSYVTHSNVFSHPTQQLGQWP